MLYLYSTTLIKNYKILKLYCTMYIHSKNFVLHKNIFVYNLKGIEHTI